MNINIIAFLSFVFVTTFTPGPNNISSASMGVLHGYKKTLKYLLGISTGFFFIMLMCGLISTAILKVFPSFEIILRIFGAAYIIWLAIETLKATYTFTDNNQSLLGFNRGLLLQVLNPKGIVYGLTLYSTFLAVITTNPLYLALSALFLAVIAFCSISIWALFGSAIKIYLRQEKIRRFVNLGLSLLLIYTAIELSGFLTSFQ